MTTWIGRIEPSMWMEGPWWHEVLPPDVRLCVLSLGVRRLRDEDFEAAHAQILDKVEALDAEGVDVINVGGSPVVSLHGKAGHERLLRDVATRTTRPFVTSIQAEVEAIRLLGATRVLIASPYPPEQTERRVRVLADDGITTAGHASLGIERNREIASLDPDIVAQQAIDLARHYPDGDLIYLPCGSLPVVGVIERMEAQTGLPVVTNVTAQVYACLARVGYARPIRGYGRLLAALGTGRPERS